MLLVSRELTNNFHMSSVFLVGPDRTGRETGVAARPDQHSGCRAEASPPALGAGHRRFESSHPDAWRQTEVPWGLDHVKNQAHSGIEQLVARQAHNL